MKPNLSHLDQFRKKEGPYRTNDGERNGFFWVKRGTVTLGIMASEGSEQIPWEHVSARACHYKGERCPTWEEMCFIKSLFWDDEECVVQYHPPASDYVNNHPFVLHLWKPINFDLQRPPSIAVGIK